MKLHDLPHWMLDWLVPCLPWLWIAVSVVGVGLIVFWWRRKRIKTPTCPKCDYDMRGSTGRSCPECGYHAKDESELLLRPKRRWALILGVLMVSCGWYVDLVQYRFLDGEPLWRAVVPTTVWVVGYDSWEPTGREVMDRRLENWSVRVRWSGTAEQRLTSRSDIRRLLYGPDLYTDRDKMLYFDWQLKLLGRRSYDWLYEQRASGQALTPMDYVHVYYYMRLAETFGNDRVTRDRIVAGLKDSDPKIIHFSAENIYWMQERAVGYVTELSESLRREIEKAPEAQPPMVNYIEGIPRHAFRRPEHIKNLESAIGRAGPEGVTVAVDWLDDPDPGIRYSAIQILVSGSDYFEYTPEFTETLVDTMIRTRWDKRCSYHINRAEMLAVDPAMTYLETGTVQEQVVAAHMLAVVFYYTPFYLRNKPIEEGKTGFDAWAARVQDPRYTAFIDEMRRREAEEVDPKLKFMANRFIAWHERLGTVEQRQAILTWSNSGRMRLKEPDSDLFAR